LERVRRLARAALGVYVKEMKIWLRYPTWIFAFIALPYMLSGLFNGIGYSIAGPRAVENFARNTGVSNPFLFYTLGTALLLATEVLLQDVAYSIRSEQLLGTFELHYLAPAPTWLIWILYLFPHSTIMVVVLLATTLPVLAFSGVLSSPIDFLYACSVLALGMLPLLGIALALAALVVRYKEPGAVVSLVQSVVILLSGYFYPLTVFPAWVSALSQVLPTTHVISILRSLLLAGEGVSPLDRRLLTLLALAVAYPVIGLYSYRRWESEARRRGELSKY